MDADISIFNAVNNKSLVSGQRSTSPIDAQTLPLFAGDTLNVNLYFLKVPVGFNAFDPGNSTLMTVPAVGFLPFITLNDGTQAGTVYAQAIVWTADASKTFWTGVLALNTVSLLALVAAQAKNGATVTLSIGYIGGDGLPKNTFRQDITVKPGAQPAAGIPVPLLTPLSVEVAQTMFFPLQPVPGQSLFLESPNGIIYARQVVDNGDGTANVTEAQVS